MPFPQRTPRSQYGADFMPWLLAKVEEYDRFVRRYKQLEQRIGIPVEEDVGGGDRGRVWLAKITAVSGGDAPIYDAVAYDSPSVAVEAAEPINRPISVLFLDYVPAEVGDKCLILQGDDGDVEQYELVVLTEEFSASMCPVAPPPSPSVSPIGPRPVIQSLDFLGI